MLKVCHTKSTQHKHNYVEGLSSLQQIWRSWIWHQNLCSYEEMQTGEKEYVLVRRKSLLYGRTTRWTGKHSATEQRALVADISEEVSDG